MIKSITTEGIMDLRDGQAEVLSDLDFTLARPGQRSGALIDTLAAITHMQRWGWKLSSHNRGMTLPRLTAENAFVHLDTETPNSNDRITMEMTESGNPNTGERVLTIHRVTIISKDREDPKRAPLRIRAGEWDDIPRWSVSKLASEFLNEDGSPMPMYHGYKIAEEKAKEIESYISGFAFYRIPDLRSEIVFDDEHHLDHLSGLSRNFSNLPHWLANTAKRDPETIAKIAELFGPLIEDFGAFRFFNTNRIEWVKSLSLYSIPRSPKPAELQTLCICAALAMPEEQRPELLAVDSLDASIAPDLLARTFPTLTRAAEETQLLIGFESRRTHFQ